MMKKQLGLSVVMFLLAAWSFALNTADIAGTWYDSKGMGSIQINRNGTGKVIFKHNPAITMKVSVSTNRLQYIIQQAEGNRWEFYRNAFPEKVAKQLPGRLRRMKWKLTLDRKKEVLKGLKETSFVEVDSNSQRVLNVDNSYIRPARWTKLEGQVATPQISPRGGTFNTSQKVYLSCSTPKATIYYTLDGSVPQAKVQNLHKGGFIRVSRSATLRVMASRNKWAPSQVVSETFVIEPVKKKPVPPKPKPQPDPFPEEDYYEEEEYYPPEEEYYEEEDYYPPEDNYYEEEDYYPPEDNYYEEEDYYDDY